MNNQRTKMQQLKQILRRKNDQVEEQMNVEETDPKKLKFVTGVIAKVQFSEPCFDIKKTKVKLKKNKDKIDIMNTL